MAGKTVAPGPMGPVKEVLVGGAASWRSLQVSDPDDEQEAAVVSGAERALRDELSVVVGAEHLVILAGLGTSLGITSSSGKFAPRMSDLWADVRDLESFSEVKMQLTPEVVAKKNLEHILSDAQSRLSLNPGDSALATFIGEAEQIVWDRCAFVDDSVDVTSHETFLRKVARRSTRLQRTQVFTTNYDLAFETAARRARFNVIDGFGFGGIEFDGGSFDLDYVRRRGNEAPVLEPSVFQLLKLHGSVNWDDANGTVRKVHDKPVDPVLIYPSATKYQLSYQQPYLEFMSRFQIALRQPEIGLIVVGFGFNDEHLTAPIRAAIRSNIGLRAIVVTPGAHDTVARSATFDEIEDLIQRGDRRLSLLAGTFDDLIKYLPDVPQMEERDAHAERLSKRT